MSTYFLQYEIRTMDEDLEEENLTEKIWNACRDGDIGKVKSLFAEKKLAEIYQPANACDAYKREQYPLHIAAANGHIEVVRFFVGKWGGYQQNGRIWVYGVKTR